METYDRVLIADCGNFNETTETLCTGTRRFYWGYREAACDLCGAYCGIGVAQWNRVEMLGKEKT